MTINWDSGDITPEQHKLRAEQLYPTVESMAEDTVAYIDRDDLSPETDGSLWIAPKGVAYPEDVAAEYSSNLDMFRIIRTADGYILDASLGDLKLFSQTVDDDHFDSGTKLSPDDEIEYDEDGWIPVIGIAETEEQRIQLGGILFNKYGIMLGRSALAIVETEEE